MASNKNALIRYKSIDQCLRNTMRKWTLDDLSPIPVSNGINSPVLEGVPEGSYILTVTDDIESVSTAAIEISEPLTSVTITNIMPTDASCHNHNDGSLFIQADGGESPYTYSINDGLSFQLSPTFNNLSSGSYTIVVKDNNECEFREDTPVLIMQPLELNIIINEQQPVSVSGGSDGAIFITVEGGSNNYTFEWSGPNGYNSTDEDITGLEEGEYTVVITDANFISSLGAAGCRYTSPVITITEPGELIATATQLVFLQCANDNHAEIEVGVQGGVGPFTYTWYKVDNSSNTLLDENTNIINGLTAGTYFATITDQANQTTKNSNNVVVSAPPLLELTIDNITHLTCIDNPTGKIDFTVSGGTGNYRYFLNNEEVTSDISNLASGDYFLEIFDEETCDVSESFTINNPEDPIEITNVTINNASAYQAVDGSIELNITGGLQPYTISWTRLSDNTNIGDQATINNLTSDSYMVIITDENNCTIEETYIVTQPDIIEATITNPSCTNFSDGSISLIVNQGDGVFTYNWLSTNETTSTITNLTAGSYTVIITGFENGPETRTYVLENPLPLEVDLGGDRTLCQNQVLDLDVSVEDDTATYLWASDNGFSSTEPQVMLTEAGTYTVTIETPLGWSATQSISLATSTDEINAEFAVSSQVFVDETVIAVDISFPLPEGVQWILPEEAKILKQDVDETQFSFAQPGEYELTLITTRGDCISETSKKVLVIAKDALTETENSEVLGKVVEEFIVYPNPTSGKFTADINLTERGEASIKIFNFANNAQMASERVRGESNYSIPFDISGMPSGVYAVVLETPYGTSLRKIIVR